MSKESLEEMMKRLDEGMPSRHWIQTSVGTVIMRNKAAAMRAGARLAEKRRLEKEANK